MTFELDIWSSEDRRLIEAALVENGYTVRIEDRGILIDGRRILIVDIPEEAKS